MPYEATQAEELMPPDDRDDEPTRALSPEETQALSGTEEPTRAMPAPDASSTQRVSPETVAAPRPAARTPAYVTERIVVPTRASLAPWLIGLIVVVALVVGAALGYTQTRPSDRNVVARALVSPSGGVMKFDGAGRLTVPKGALSSPTAITIRRDTIGHPVRLGAEGDPRSVTYEAGELVVYAFEPSDLRFQQPVTIELPRVGDGSAVFVNVRGSPHVVPAQADGTTVKVQTLSFSFSREEDPTS